MIQRALTRAYLVSCLLTLTAASAYAQTPEERAGARAAARSGVEAYNAKKYGESLDLFTRAEKLVHAPTHLLYIARNNLKLGKLVRAQEAYQQLAREKLGADAPKPFVEAQQAAVQELSEFEARIPMVTVNLKGIADPAKAQVTIDGQPVAAALVGIPFPADPGVHRFAVSAPGYSASPTERSLDEGSRATIELTLVATGEPETPAAATTASGSSNSALSKSEPPPADSKQGHSSYRIPAYISLGVGAVGVAAGVYFVLQYNDKNNQADSAANACSKANNCEARAAEIDALDADAADMGTYATIAFIAGGVGVAAGVTLLLLDSGSSKSTATLSQPTLRAYMGPASVGLTGTF